MRTDTERVSWWVVTVFCALLCLPYLPMARGYFFTDDWVHLNFNRSIPPWQLWRYFSPRVIWFYRPLQAMQFGWLYHLVGLQPLAYNLSLLAMHFGVCMLVYRLILRLTTPRMALLTTALFGTQWVYASMLTWRSNFSTVQWALVTLGMAILFLRYLETGERRALIGVYALLVTNFFIREAVMNAPLLLGALWWYQQGSLRSRARCAVRSAQPEAEARLDADTSSGPALVAPPEPAAHRAPRTAHREAFRVLAPVVFLVLVYAVLHKLCVRDVYQGYVVPCYRLVGIRLAIQQTLYALNYLLLTFIKEPLELVGLAPAVRGLTFLSSHGYLLLLALGAIAWRWRDRQVALGLVWALAAMLPTVVMTGFHCDRFYYLPTVGSALIVARFLQRGWRRLRELPLARPVAVIALGFLAAANVSVIVRTGLNNLENGRRDAAAFHALQAERGRLPAGSLVILKNLIEPAGFGMVDMVQMALADPTAMGVLEGQRMPPVWTRRLDQIPMGYLLDCGQDSPRISCFRRSGREWSGDARASM